MTPAEVRIKDPVPEILAVGQRIGRCKLAGYTPGSPNLASYVWKFRRNSER